MEGIVEKIKKILVKEGKPRYSVKIEPEQWEKIEKVMKEYTTELEAENLVLKKKLKELEKKLKELEGKEEPEEIKVVKEALKKKREIERKKKRFRFLPEKKVKVISSEGDVFASPTGKLPYLYALEVEETEGGDYKVNLLLTDGKKKMGRLETTLSFDQLFCEPHVVSKLKIGNFPVPIKGDGQELIKIARKSDIIGDMKRLNKAFMEETSRLKKELEIANSTIAGLRKENETLKVALDRLGTEISILQHKLEVSNAVMKALGVRERELTDRTALLEIGSRDLAVRSIIAMSEYNQLLEAFNHLKSMISTAFLAPPDEETRQRVLAEVERVANILESMRPKEIKIEELPKKEKGGKGG